jgi:lysophospholipase L1-like esterase
MTSPTTASGVVVRVDTSGTVSTVYTWPGATATNIEFGADGQLYVSVYRNYSLYLDRLDPSSGNVSYELPLGGCGGGLSVRWSTAVWESCPPIFIPLSNPTATSPAAYGVVGPDGSVFGLGAGGCALSALTKTEPTGGGGWTKSVGSFFGSTIDASCNTGEVMPTPGGGAVVSVIDGNRVLLVWIDSTGSSFATASPSFGGTPIAPQLDVDGSGQAVLSTSVALTQGCNPNIPSQSCEDIEVKVFDKGRTVSETVVSSSTGSSIRLGPPPTTDIAARVINGGIVLWAQSFSGTVNTYTDSFEVIPLPVTRDWWRDPARSSAPTSGPGYVALGDSYSSGEGNPPFLDSVSGCDQSISDAWPELLASQAPLSLESLLACSGATTKALYSSFKGQPAQLSQLASLSTPKLVTITIGGNDLGFGSILYDCFIYDCSSDGTLKLATNSLPELANRLALVYKDLKAAVPKSTVLVVGYPQIFPGSAKNALHHCLWLKAPAEARGLHKLGVELNQTLSIAAHAAGVKYVPTITALKGHELCTAQSWVNSVGLSSGAGHPTAEGQASIASVVLTYVKKHHLI